MIEKHWTKQSGGTKHSYLTANKEHVQWLVDNFGTKTTLQILDIRRLETLERAIRAGSDDSPRRLNQPERAEFMSKIAISGVDELGRRVYQLEGKAKTMPVKVILEPFTGYLLRIVEANDAQLTRKVL